MKYARALPLAHLDTSSSRYLTNSTPPCPEDYLSDAEFLDTSVPLYICPIKLYGVPYSGGFQNMFLRMLGYIHVAQQSCLRVHYTGMWSHLQCSMHHDAARSVKELLTRPVSFSKVSSKKAPEYDQRLWFLRTRCRLTKSTRSNAESLSVQVSINRLGFTLMGIENIKNQTNGALSSTGQKPPLRAKAFDMLSPPLT